MHETISDFANMCTINEVGDSYQLILTNSYSKTTYVVQIGKDLFNMSMETRAVWEGKPYKMSDVKPKEPEMTT